MDEEKVQTHVKADAQWGPVFADKDSLISRCVTFSNSFSKGKFNFFIEHALYI
jgi:hypothetical protein